MDGFEGKTPRARYDYPFAEPPAPGAAIEVAPGVRWVRMPLPFALKWINLWLIEDGDGWTVVDTGVQTSETKALWRTIFSENLEGRPVRRVIVTHMHPDHVGLAGWMTRKFGCELLMTRLEYITCRMLVADTGREAILDGDGRTFGQVRTERLGDTADATADAPAEMPEANADPKPTRKRKSAA